LGWERGKSIQKSLSVEGRGKDDGVLEEGGEKKSECEKTRIPHPPKKRVKMKKPRLGCGGG